MTSPLSRRTKFKWHAYDRIRDMLMSGDIAPGSRVSDAEIAKQIGASRTPVREAILEAVEAGDTKEADRLMAQHMRNGQHTQMQTMDQPHDADESAQPEDEPAHED